MYLIIQTYQHIQWVLILISNKKQLNNQDMKTNIKKYLILALVAFLFGCEDYLNITPPTLPGDKSFYSTPDELKAAILSCYNFLSTSTITANDQPNTLAIDHMADDMIGSSIYTSFVNGTITSSDTNIKNYWANLFQGVTRCNLLLDRMSNAQAVTPPALYKQIQSEARVMRAKLYFELASNWGSVPLLTTILPQTEYRYIEKTDRDTIFNFVIRELEQSANSLPLSYTGSDYGRFTKGAALGLAARAALYAAFIRNPVQPDLMLMSKVIAFTDTVKSSNVYILNSDYRTLFMYGGEHSKETVISECYNTVATKTHKIPYNFLPNMASGISKFSPVQDLIDAYECTDGLPIDKSSLYDPKIPFKNRDPRLAKTIMLPRVNAGATGKLDSTTLYPGTTWTVNGYVREFKNTISSIYDKNFSEGGKNVTNPEISGTSYKSITGYAILKYCDPQDQAVLQASQMDVMLMRYAEILLMNAEARIERNQGDDLVKAAEYMNIVKARAYGVTPTIFATNAARVLPTLTQSEMRKRLRMERRMEFAFEGLRYNDLRRWNLALTVLPGTRYGRPTNFYDMAGLIPTIDDNGIARYSDVIIAKLKPATTTVRTYSTTFLLSPVPLDEYKMNNGLGQNTGY